MISTAQKIRIVQAEARKNGGTLTDEQARRRAEMYSDAWFQRRIGAEPDHHLYRGRDRVANLAISRADAERGQRG